MPTPRTASTRRSSRRATVAAPPPEATFDVETPAFEAPSARSQPCAIDADVRRAMIAQAAYFRAERRGFAPGGEMDDWLGAEVEIDALLQA
jgi:hypothetical protein